MAAPLKLEKFGGMLPAWSSKLLPEGQGELALNCYLFSGELMGWRKPKLLRALTNSAARNVYRVPTITQATASALYVFLANPSEGDTVKVGEEIYRFVTAGSGPNPTAYDVLLEISVAATAANFLAALTGGAGAGTKYSTGIVANPAISQVAGVNTLTLETFSGPTYNTITLKAPDFGTAFNTTAVTESTGNVRGTWIYDLTLAHVTTTFRGGANQSFDSNITGAATWLEFVDRDTDVVRSPVVDDKFGRYYFASPSLPPKYNTYDRIVAVQDPWLLGVPPPGCAPVVSIAGGGDNATLGFPTDTTSTSVLVPGNSIILLKVTPTGAMELKSVSFNPATTLATGKFAAVLYDDNSGTPGTLLNIGAQIGGWSAGIEALSPFANPTGLLSGTPYWIGVMVSDNVNVELADNNATGASASNTYSNGPPPAISGTLGQPDWQMWGTLQTGSVLAARAYAYTWVTGYDEEGPPSPATLVNGWSNGTWTIGLFTPPADEMGVTRNITKKRLYRTISSQTGLTTYFLVAELPVAQDTYVDIIEDDVVALANQLESLLWFPPPEGLLGITAMPNGMVVGFKGNELWFAEQYRPHAWPPGYVLTTEFPIIGIGVIGQAVVACTGGVPYIATGASPNAMTLTRTKTPEPCNSRGSVVSVADGVLYTSPNGLIKVSQMGQVANTTELWITREKWRTLTPSKSTHAVQMASSYFAFGTVEIVNGSDDTSLAQQGYTIEINADDANSFGIWPQPGGHRLGFNQMTAPGDFNIYNVQIDPWTGIGLLIQNNSVYYYDFSDAAPVSMTYKWRSRIFQQKAKDNFEALKVFFSVPAGTPTQSATRDTTDPQPTLGANQYGIVRAYADGVLRTTREIRKSGELLRILSGYKTEDWQFEFEGRVPISNVQIATSVRELGGV